MKKNRKGEGGKVKNLMGSENTVRLLEIRTSVMGGRHKRASLFICRHVCVHGLKMGNACQLSLMCACVCNVNVINHTNKLNMFEEGGGFVDLNSVSLLFSVFVLSTQLLA